MNTSKKLDLIEFLSTDNMPPWILKIHRDRMDKRAKIREMNAIFMRGDMDKVQQIESIAHSISINN